MGWAQSCAMTGMLFVIGSLKHMELFYLLLPGLSSDIYFVNTFSLTVPPLMDFHGEENQNKSVTIVWCWCESCRWWWLVNQGAHWADTFHHRLKCLCLQLTICDLWLHRPTLCCYVVSVRKPFVWKDLWNNTVPDSSILPLQEYIVILAALLSFWKITQ